ncbi:MAG TPA: hypothetical protein VLT92_13565 [Burkholderiales bacterium]|nr:hypothetical protein [Burkholderiales bacterium]
MSVFRQTWFPRHFLQGCLYFFALLLPGGALVLLLHWLYRHIREDVK